MTIIISAFLVIFFFACSFFMSMSEAAITSLSKYRIRKIVALQKPLQELFIKWLHYPQDFLTTILVGNTLANMFVSVFATYLAVSSLEQSGVRFNRTTVEFATWVVITTLVLIFGDLMPKILSRSNPERTSVTVIRLIGIVNKLLTPVTMPILWLANALTGGTKSLPASRLSSLTIEDINLAVRESLQKGGIETETTHMLEGALKITKVRVSDIMAPAAKVDAIDLSEDREDIIDRLVNTGHSRVPVYRGDKNNIVGIVILKDLLSTKAETLVQFSEELIRPAITVSPETNVSDLLHEFQKGATHCAVVADGKGVFRGFITLEDILEEIVGEILDEYDLAKQNAATAVTCPTVRAGADAPPLPGGIK